MTVLSKTEPNLQFPLLSSFSSAGRLFSTESTPGNLQRPFFPFLLLKEIWDRACNKPLFYYCPFKAVNYKRWESRRLYDASSFLNRKDNLFPWCFLSVNTNMFYNSQDLQITLLLRQRSPWSIQEFQNIQKPPFSNSWNEQSQAYYFPCFTDKEKQLPVSSGINPLATTASF